MLKFKTVNITATTLLAGLYIAGFVVRIPLWSYVTVLIVWTSITIYSSFSIKYNYYFKSLLSNYKTSEKQVAITFDDGPNPLFTPQILELLKRFGAKATFFCIGKQVEKHPELFRKIIADGHTVGNHTYSHSPYFGFFPAKKVVRELEHTNRAVKEVTGLEMRLYRPAFGVTNPHIAKALKLTGLKSVGWSKRSLDTTGLGADPVFRRVTHRLKKGDVILLHDSSEKTVAVLERLLLFLQKNHIKSVTVDTLFNIRPYA